MKENPSGNDLGKTNAAMKMFLQRLPTHNEARLSKDVQKQVNKILKKSDTTPKAQMRYQLQRCQLNDHDIDCLLEDQPTDSEKIQTLLTTKYAKHLWAEMEYADKQKLTARLARLGFKVGAIVAEINAISHKN